jgi:hypothetical protein
LARRKGAYLSLLILLEVHSPDGQGRECHCPGEGDFGFAQAHVVVAVERVEFEFSAGLVISELLINMDKYGASFDDDDLHWLLASPSTPISPSDIGRHSCDTGETAIYGHGSSRGRLNLL